MRLVLAISLDGRLAPANGGPAKLGGDGDRKVLEEALAWSDALLIGAGTLRAHKSICLIHSSELIHQRLSEGRSQQPIALLVSKQKNFCTNWKFFNQPIERWLLSPRQKLEQSDDKFFSEKVFKRQILMKEKWSDTLDQIYQLGISRIVLLGGANLVEGLISVDMVDELQLTITPKLLGGEKVWLPISVDFPRKGSLSVNPWDLQSINPLGSNELMVKYLRNRSLDLTSNNN